MLAILNIGPLELLLLGAAAVLLFGGDLPDVARKAARMAGRLRGMTNDLTREFKENTDFEDKLRRPPQLDQPPIQKKFSVSDWRPANSPPGSEDAPIEVANEGDLGGDDGRDDGDDNGDDNEAIVGQPASAPLAQTSDPGLSSDAPSEHPVRPTLTDQPEGGAPGAAMPQTSGSTTPGPVEPEATPEAEADTDNSAGDEKSA